MSESQNIEYKSSWHDDYLKWICGFANAQGGKIYIGIDDKGNVVGIENSHELSEKIPNKIRNAMGITAEVNLLKDKNDETKTYLEIVV
jgi:ATP-dependent DNA helicase RecG